MPMPTGGTPGLPGWDVYNAYRELNGLDSGALPAHWRAPVARSFLNCEQASYPSILAFPERATDAHLAAVAPFRSKALRDAYV